MVRTYNDLLVDYRKSYANKLDIYPKTLDNMMDVMRQVTPKKKRAAPKNDKDTTQDKDKSTELESSHLQTTDKDKGGAACYCCSDPICRLY